MILKVVYLDDEVALLEMFKEAFAEEDINIVTFDVPEDAIQYIRANPPDIVFLDYRLPGTSGDEVAQKLDPKLPKVLITGDLSVHPKTQFLHIFRKPYKPSEMRDFLKAFKTAA